MRKTKLLSIGLLFLACTYSTVDTESKELRSRSTECCRICRKGKACGDSCINKQLTCHKAPGCACDG